MTIMDLKKHKETSTQVLARFDLKFSLSSIMKIIIIDEHVLRFSNKLLIVLAICLLFFKIEFGNTKWAAVFLFMVMFCMNKNH